MMLALMALCAVGGHPRMISAQDTPRVLSAHDTLRLNVVGSPRLSPDGSWVLYTPVSYTHLTLPTNREV